jgi:hypothetical protein
LKGLLDEIKRGGIDEINKGLIQKIVESKIFKTLTKPENITRISSALLNLLDFIRKINYQ